MKKIVIPSSGGIDSSTMIGYYLDREYEVYPMFVIYGQKNVIRELKSIISFINFLKKKYGSRVNKLKVFDIDGLVYNIEETNSILVGDSVPSNNDDKKLNFVPARNIIILSLAVSYAEFIGTTYIGLGSHKEKEFPFPDSSKEFADIFGKMATEGTFKKENDIVILTPFLSENLFKSGVVKLSEKLELPLELTWTCYDNKFKHCGKCKACLDRKTAFKEANILDPTQYEGENNNVVK